MSSAAKTRMDAGLSSPSAGQGHACGTSRETEMFTSGSGVPVSASAPPTLATMVKPELVGCQTASYRAGRV